MPNAQGQLLPGEPGYVAPVPQPGVINTLETPAVKAATASPPTAVPFTVEPNATVQSNIRGIISEDSPLMQQAAARAAGQMNARGLLNSSQAIGAGQAALYDAALPIAQADAATYARAGEATAAARNAAELQRANIETSTSQFNANATNVQQLQQLDITARDKIAQLQANTTLTGLDRQIAGQKIITDADNAARNILARLQADTSITLADKQTAAQQAIAAADNAARAVIAQLQADTTLTTAQKQLAANEIIAARESETKVVMQRFQLDADLQKIDVDGTIRQSLMNTEAQYKMLMQTSAGTADLYKQSLANFAAIIANPDIADKTGALNLGVQQLNDALKLLGDVVNMDLGSYLTFDVPAGAGATTPAPALDDSRGKGSWFSGLLG